MREGYVVVLQIRLAVQETTARRTPTPHMRALTLYTRWLARWGEHLVLLNADRHGSFQETSARGGEMKTPLVQSKLLHDARKVC